MFHSSMRVATFALLLAACGGPIVAIESTDHSFTTSAAPQVVVRSYNGHVNVMSGADGSVAATVKKTSHGWSDSDAEGRLKNVIVSFTQQGDTVTVTATHRGTGDTGADVDITAPVGTTLDLETSNGKVTASGTQGTITAQTSNGAVDLSAGAGTVHVSTSNGSVSVSPRGTASVILSTSNGSIDFHGTLLDGLSTFDTSNGNIDLFFAPASAFQLDAATSNGNVSCTFPMVVTSSTESSLHAVIGTNPSTQVRANSSNGSIHVSPM